MILNSPPRLAWDNLVQLAHSLRPEWQAPGIQAGIRAALNREAPFDFAALVSAVVRAASDPGARTPQAITHDAYWPSLAPAAVVYGITEGDPRVICAVCSLTEDACRYRARTNGHEFVSRFDHDRIARPAKEAS